MGVHFGEVPQSRIMKMDKSYLLVSGLPRSGSTLLCNLLGHHPDIYSIQHSSPLLGTLLSLRHSLSNNDFLLSQMDPNFEKVYSRLTCSYRGFIRGWFEETDRPWVVDKNRGWLQQIELAAHLLPKFKIVVCVRELGQIFGSVEKQHHKTMLLDFPDSIGSLTKLDRAKKLFEETGIVGQPLKSIEALHEIPAELQKNLFYLPYEQLVSNPLQTLSSLWGWLGIQSHKIDVTNLVVPRAESDSYYRFKYPHKVRASICPGEPHLIPSRIQEMLEAKFDWYYSTFYPPTPEK